MEKTFNQYEFRLNKKNAECFRTADFNEALAKLQELQAKRPVYSMQYRYRTFHTYSYKFGFGPWEKWRDLSKPEQCNPECFTTKYPKWY